MALISIGDIHLKKEEPYLSGLKKLFQWILDNHRNNDFIFNGDIYDSSSPHWDIVEIFLNFIDQINGQVFVFSGNHDKSYIKGNAIKSLTARKNVKIFLDKEEFIYNDMKILLLPHLSNMNEYQELKGEWDYIFIHGCPLIESFGNEGVAIPNLKGTVIWSHIHKSKDFVDHNKNYILGVIQCSRNLEQYYENYRILKIDKENVESISLPTFMTIEDIKFGEEPKSKNNLLNIINVPSLISVYDRYSIKDGYYIRRDGIEVLQKEEEIQGSSLENIQRLKDSLENKFVDYAKSKEVRESVINRVLSYMEKVPENVEV